MSTAPRTSSPDAAIGVLITRPQPGAGETAACVLAMGYRPVVAPVLEIHMRPAPLPPSCCVQAMVATSGSAIPALPASHHDLPLFAVGAATAARARAAGFATVISANGDSSALAGLVAQSCDPAAGPLLFPCGRDQGRAFASDLRARGFSVIRRVVYAATPATVLPASAHEAFTTATLTAAMFFSAETARQCVRLLQGAGLRDAVGSVDALAISEPAAVALQALPWRRTRIAAQPNQDAMLALLR